MILFFSSLRIQYSLFHVKTPIAAEKIAFQSVPTKTKQKKWKWRRSAHQFSVLHVHVRVAVATLQLTQYVLISTFSLFPTSDINYKNTKALIKNPKWLKYGHDVFLPPCQKSRLFNSICSQRLGTANGRFSGGAIPLVSLISKIKLLNKIENRERISFVILHDFWNFLQNRDWGKT